MPAMATMDAPPTTFATGSQDPTRRRRSAGSKGILGWLALLTKGLVWLAVVGSALYLIAT